jgi:hypothetical protein
VAAAIIDRRDMEQKNLVQELADLFNKYGVDRFYLFLHGNDGTECVCRSKDEKVFDTVAELIDDEFVEKSITHKLMGK